MIPRIVPLWGWGAILKLIREVARVLGLWRVLDSTCRAYQGLEIVKVSVRRIAIKSQTSHLNVITI